MGQSRNARDTAHRPRMHRPSRASADDMRHLRSSLLVAPRRRSAAALVVPRRRSAAALAAAVLLTACAHSAGAAPPASKPAGKVDSEAAALEAARHHPIAKPEPRPAYPDQAPPARPPRGLPEKAPPPREERGLPEKAPLPLDSSSNEAPAGEIGPAETRLIAPEQPPLQAYAEPRPRSPYPDYVWAPGYWYWSGGRYVWITGGWIAPRPGHVYVSARWIYGSDGWEFSPGGWAVGFGGPVVYPHYPHAYYGYSHYGYPHRHYGYGNDRHHGWGQRHWDAPRRGRSSDRTTVRPGRSYSTPRRPTVVRPSSRSTSTGDLPSSGGRTKVKARRR